MPPEAYNEWISIYNDEIREKWASERVELRKLSMIYCAFQNELSKLKEELDTEIEGLKSDLKRRDFLQKSKRFVGFAETQLHEANVQDNKENDLPEIVPLREFNRNDSKTEDFLIETPNTPLFFDGCPSPPLAAINKTPSAISNNKKSSPNSSVVVYPVISHKAEKAPKLFEQKSSKNHNDSNIMECSIIEDTPDIKSSKKTKSYKLSLVKSKKSKLSQSKQKTTLTQLLLGTPKKKKKKREIDSNGPSMSINAMIDLINDNSGSETDPDLDKTVDDLEKVTEDKNEESFVVNYDKIPEKKDSPKHVYNEVVRGKERKQLKGWSCRECENYYKGFNLPPEELEAKKNHCSRHRHRFKAREETFDGFWDLTFGPTPKTQEDNSLRFDFKKV